MRTNPFSNQRCVLAAFASEHELLVAAQTLRDRGYTIHEAYTPYPVHGLDSILAVRPTRLPMLCLLFGITGAAAKLWFQVWTSAGSWPLNVGGKPLASVPAFVPITFEVTVLFAGIGSVLAFLLRSRLRPGKRARIAHPRATDDAFVLVTLVDRADVHVGGLMELCHALRASEVYERSEVPS